MRRHACLGEGLEKKLHRVYSASFLLVRLSPLSERPERQMKIKRDFFFEKEDTFDWRVAMMARAFWKRALLSAYARV